MRKETMKSDKELLDQAELAMQDAAERVVEDARRTHGVVVVWEQGTVRQLPPDQLPAHIRRTAAGRTDARDE
jgi:hypothetical protein